MYWYENVYYAFWISSTYTEWHCCLGVSNFGTNKHVSLLVLSVALKQQMNTVQLYLFLLLMEEICVFRELMYYCNEV